MDAAVSRCYHCDLPVSSGVDHRLDLSGTERHFCCAGCMAVASTIDACGLDRFYQHREAAQAPVSQDDLHQENYLWLDDPALAHPALKRQGRQVVLSLSLFGITCSACVWIIEKVLTDRPGVISVRVNQATQRALIELDTELMSISELFYRLASLGYQAVLGRDDERTQRLRRDNKVALMRLGVAFIGMMQVGMYGIALHFGEVQDISPAQRDLMRLASLLIATAIVFFSATPFFSASWRALKLRRLVMDVPVSIAIGGAYLASIGATFSGRGEVYFDSIAMFVFLLLLSRYLEARARARLDFVPLQTLIPDTVWLADESGLAIRQVSSHALRVGDRILVEPGQRVPADGMVLRGEGFVDESVVTGEFRPVRRQAGDLLVSGVLNGDGRYLLRIERTGADSMLGDIGRLYEEAVSAKTPAIIMADRISGWFVAGVLVASVASYLVWWQLDPSKAFWIALAVLVVSCPCALSIATPASFTAAIAGMRKIGLLIRHPQVLEQLSRTTDVVFDKTGTLTEGQPQIRSVQCPGSSPEATCLAVAAALESVSTHPYARAFRGIAAASMSDLVSVSGQGVKGCLDGVEWRIGSRVFTGAGLEEPLSAPETGEAHVWLANSEGLQALIHITDPVRSSAANAIEALGASGIRVHMITGDSSPGAAAVANLLGIEQWRQGMTPDDKLGYMQALRERDAVLLYVGDGINDIPAMGVAQSSMVVADAPDLVQSHADIGSMVADLRMIPRVIQHSRRVRRVVRQNLSWALGYNIAALPLAAMGFIPPWLAAIGMSASSLVVVMGALRLTRAPEQI